MHPRGPRRALLALAALAGVACAEDKAATKSTSTTATSTATACVATSTSGSFFDLRPDVAVIADKTTKKSARTEDYQARGWDYGTNFTMNICGAVVKGVEDAMGVEKALWKNISAYYVQKGQVFSLGSQSGTLVPRGRKLVLQYKDGSPCGVEKSKRSSVREGSYRHFADDDDDDDDDESKPAGKKSKEDDQKPGKGKEDDKDDKKKDDDKDDKDKDKDTDKGREKEKSKHRKSATISFLCDRDPTISTAISFVGTDPDECAYFFEVRSQHACAGAEPHKPGSVGPASVFAIIFGITVLVYILGGIFYQRTVAHARGWRQLPNYSLWAGIWNFVKDIFIILTSSCARFLPSRRGYHTLSVSPSARNRNREDENRLIDQLDEEWDD